MIQLSEEKAQYLSDFESLQRDGDKGPSWVCQIREAAAYRFAELRFPTTRDEEWRFTNVAPILRIPFKLVRERSLDGLARDQIEQLALVCPEEHRLVFVNGLHLRELSSSLRLPDGVRAASLAEAAITDSDLVRQHLARYAGYDDNAFTALNTAFIYDGALVYVPNGKVVEAPMHLIFVSTARHEAAVSHPRILIVVGRGSIATVIESYLSPSYHRHFTNAVTEVVLAEGAVLDHYKIQMEDQGGFHIATIQVQQGRDSSYTSFSFAVGAEISRNNLNVLLNGEGADCTLNGLYMVGGDQHVDNHTLIDHAVPRCTSRELYKGILDGRARGVFDGKIRVRKGAQLTDAIQINKNLILSEHALANTNPRLEIFADDVKCTHGATVGQLDEEALYYLRSRGLSYESARGILTYGFASDVINRIKLEPIRDQLNRLVLTKFGRHQ